MCLDITKLKSRFKTVKASITGGVRLGEGSCRGVILSVNYYKPNSDTAQVVANNKCRLYYGDQHQQTKELLVGFDSDDVTLVNTRNSGFIPCTDLSQIWIRAFGTGITSLLVEVQIFVEGDD